MTSERHTMIGPPSDTQAGPHVFTPLERQDRKAVDGRCAICMAPRYAHPEGNPIGWQPSRALGDKTPSLSFHDLMVGMITRRETEMGEKIQRIAALEAELAEARRETKSAKDRMWETGHENTALRAEIQRKDAALRHISATFPIEGELLDRYSPAIKNIRADFWSVHRSVWREVDAALSSGDGEDGQDAQQPVGREGDPEPSSPTLSREATRLEIHLLEEVLSEVIASMTESMDAAQRPKGSGYCDIRPYTVNEWRHSLVAILDAAQEESQ